VAAAKCFLPGWHLTTGRSSFIKPKSIKSGNCKTCYQNYTSLIFIPPTFVALKQKRMIHYETTKLVINHETTEPMKERERLCQSIAAAIRWYATSDSTRDDDVENLHTLANLQGSLFCPE
jgi:hypothetical protein